VVFVVAVVSLGSPLDSEIPAFATELALAPYDVRQRFAAGFPSVIWGGTDRARAQELLARMRARGHAAIACDTSAVVTSDRMVSMRDFQLVDSGVAADASTTLPFDDVRCFLRAVQRRTIETTKSETTRKFNAGIALATGGMVVRRSESKETVQRSEEREQVLYAFRKSGATPWILRETTTRYGALGAALAPATLQNFLATIRLFRERAPKVPYDERLLTLKSSEPTVAAHGGIDLLAHLTAMCF